MIITIKEVIDIILMTLIMGFIFKDIFKQRLDVKNVMNLVKQKSFNWNDFWFACILVAPSIILHELGHKFMAMYFGLQATFHAAYTWLALGVILKLVNFGFIFFIPAYVSILGQATHLQYAAISFAGPAVHLIFWALTSFILPNPHLTHKFRYFVFMMNRINMWLFIFNMLPIPGLDGFHVYTNLIQAI